MNKFAKIVLNEGVFLGKKTTTLPDGTIRTESDAYVEYRMNWKLHRLDGPAYVNKYSGYQAWYLNGHLHRTDGPAIIHRNGFKEYFVNGKEFTKAEFDRHFGGD